MVDLSADAVVGFDVGAVEVADEVEGCLEVSLDHVELEFESTESFFDVVQLAGETVLLALEEVERKGARVMGLEQLGSFVESAALSGDELLPLDACVLAKCSDLFENLLFGLEPQVFAEFDGLVVAGDRVLDVLDQEGPLVAAGAASLSPDADEVGVDAL